MHVLAPDLVGVLEHTPEVDSRPHTMRVMVVDDNPGDARIIALLLEAGPYSCATVTSYQEGIDVIRQQAHDAYLIDYRLGNRTGLELILEIADGASGPMILLTGLDDPALDGLALAAGASDYLSKNRLNSEDVTRSIRYSVETWKAKRSAEIERERFRALYEGVPIGIGRLSKDGVFTEANQFLTNLFGYPDGLSLIGTPVADLLKDRAEVDILLASRPDNDPFPIELEMKRYDGSHIWVGGVLRTRRGSDGELSGFEGAIGDITARKKAEKDVAIQNAVLDQVRSAVVTKNMSGEVTFWNRHAEELFGWTALEVIGEPMGDILVPTTSAEEAREITRVIAETGHWAGEHDALRKDGTTVPIFVTNTVISDDTGLPLAVVDISTDITERVASDRTLRKSQALFQEMFEGSPIGKSLFEVPSGRMVAVNQAAAEFIGIPIEGLVGISRVANTDPHDLAADQVLFDRLIAGEITSYEIEKHYELADGNVKWALVKVALIGDLEDGAGLGMAYAIDITARKAAEAEVRFQASLLGQVHNAVIATDLSGAVIYWNSFAEEFYGWSAEEILGRNLYDATSVAGNHQGELVAEAGAALFATGQWEGEVTLFRKDGSSLPAWATDALLRDQAGNPIGIVGVRVDLTNQKHSQAEAERQGDLAQSVLAALHDPHAVIAFDGRILVANGAWEAWMAEAVASVPKGGVGVDYLELCRTGLGPEGFDSQVIEGIESVLTGASPRFVHDYSLTKAGTLKWFRLDVTPSSGTGAVCARWDITDERRVRRGLEDLIRAKDEFIASVSHELRTPLTAVVGLTHELSEGRVRPEEVIELQSLIAQQAQEVSDIVEDLLVAARASADTITVRPSPFNIRPEVELVVRPWLRGDAQAIDLSRVDAALICRGDAGRVRQIMRNLVANAVRYGGKPVAIEARSDGNTVSVVVRDHGKGIPFEAVERMFEPYARLGGITGLPSSVGLGLYVSRLLARLMNGDLKYSRGEGVTEFILTLPAERRKAVVAGMPSGRVNDRTDGPGPGTTSSRA